MCFQTLHIFFQELNQSVLIEIVSNAERSDDFFDGIRGLPIDVSIYFKDMMPSENKLEESKMASKKIKLVVIDLLKLLTFQIFEAK